jgi:hypothetical protein
MVIHVVGPVERGTLELGVQVESGILEV